MGWVVKGTPQPLYPRKDPVPIVWENGSGRVRKNTPPPGFDSRTAHPVASHYTNSAHKAEPELLTQ